MKNAIRGIIVVSALGLGLVAAGVSAQRRGAGVAAGHTHPHPQGDAGVADASAADAGEWIELGSRTVNGRRDRDTIRVARRHNPITHVLVRVESSDVEIYDMVITFADGTTYAPELRVTFREGSRSRRIDLPGAGRVVRKVEFRYGNLPEGGNARVELLGQI